MKNSVQLFLAMSLALSALSSFAALQCPCSAKSDAKSDATSGATSGAKSAPSSQPAPAAKSANTNSTAGTKLDESVVAAHSLDPELLRRLSASTKNEVLCAVASNPKTPPDVLLNLARSIKPFRSVLNMDDGRDIFMALVQNPVLPADVIVALDKNIPMQAGFEELPYMPARILAKRESYDHPYDSEDPEYKDYEALKRGLFTSDDQVLRLMAASPSTKLRWQAALNAGTPRDVLIALANRKNEDRSVIENLARNPAMPIEYLRQFATHKEDQVRHELAENPSCPKEVLQQLLKDKSSYVSNAARQTLYFFHNGQAFWQ